MPTYTFKLVITTSSDEFWEDIEKRGVTGCEEVTALVKDALFSVGIDPDYEFSHDTLTLEKYDNADI
jgi:predicted nucleic acid-binding Zn ribbon protein